MIKYHFDKDTINVQFVKTDIQSISIDLLLLNELIIEDLVKNNFSELQQQEKEELIENSIKLLGYMLVKK